jgi:hypothetical protein
MTGDLKKTIEEIVMNRLEDHMDTLDAAAENSRDNFRATSATPLANEV